MDPNETLRRLRALLGGDHSGVEINDSSTRTMAEHFDDLLGMVCEAEELWQALDGWISTGGGIPEDWTHPVVREAKRLAAWEAGRDAT